jgi:hypothetical protein
MSKAIPTQFPLSFSNLDEVVQRLDLLREVGYTSIGNWNLAQGCEHLRDWFSFMIDGYPAAPVPLSWVFWGMRVTIGKSMLRKILKTKTMASGGPTMKQTVHAATNIDDETSVQRLKEMIERFKSHHGPFCPSPLYGKLSAEDGLALQLIHCTHHLRFLTPNSRSHVHSVK